MTINSQAGLERHIPNNTLMIELLKLLLDGFLIVGNFDVGTGELWAEKEEAKEITLLLIKRDMKFQTFFMSQICQASHSFTLYKLARIAGCAISPSGRELEHLLSQKNFGDRSLARHRPRKNSKL